jgi:mRNA interferase RelE/StbE
MALFEIWIKKSAEKEIRAIPTPHRRRVINRIQTLAENPRPVGSVKLAGREGWRLRVGVYRIIYTVEDDRLVVEVIKIAHRRDVYR